MTTITSTHRKPLHQNKFALLTLSIYLLFWLGCYFYNTDELNWWIENLLVIIFIPVLLFSQKRFQFSDWSILSMFLFLALHTFGAKNAYTYNTFGEWLQNTYQLERNPYDRIVHTGFGVFMVYPMMDLLYNKYKVPLRFLLLLSCSFILCLATIFELIEWTVAACTDSETGETYVATQGDVWDAHKDIILAWIGAGITGYFFKKRHFAPVQKQSAL